MKAGLGGRVRDSIQLASETSRRTQSLKIAKELAGPREMLSSGSSIISSSSLKSQASDYGPRCRRQPADEELDCVQGPRGRDTIYPLSNLDLSPESGSTVTKPLLRSILKVKVNRPPTRRVQHDDQLGNTKNPSTIAVTKHYGHKGATKRTGITDETLKVWSSRFVPVDTRLTGGETDLMTKGRRKLPQPPRKLAINILEPLSSPSSAQNAERPQSGDLSVPSLVKFPGALSDYKIGNSSSSLISSTNPSIDNNRSSISDVDCSTTSNEQLGELYDIVLHDFLSSPTDSRRTTASTCDSGATTSTWEVRPRPVPRSSAASSSIFSHRRHSARTTLMTEIEESHNTVVKDMKEVAPEVVLEVEKSLLRELLTKSDGLCDGLEVPLQSPIAMEVDKELDEMLSQLRAEEKAIMDLKETHAEILRWRVELSTKLRRENEELRWMVGNTEERICNPRISTTTTASLFGELPQYTPQYSQVVKELEEAVSELRAKEGEIRDLRDMNVELIRRRMGLVTKLELQNEELQRTLDAKEEQIYNLRHGATEPTVEPPEYTLVW